MVQTGDASNLVKADHGTVLLVENDEDAARLLAKALEQKGYDTEICPSSDAALTIAEQGCEVIIAAVRGPGMDGLGIAPPGCGRGGPTWQ